MGGSLLSKVEVPSSSLLGHLPKEFSLRLTWCPWLVGYYGTRWISRGARKLARTPSLPKKKKRSLFDKDILLLLGMAACAFGVAIGYIGPIRIRNFIPISS